MILSGPCGHLPSAHRMAILTLRAELAAVQVRVAIGAALAGFGEYFGHVAGGTLHAFVHTAQSEPGFAIVIEFHLRAKRRPAGGGVAVFAGDGDWAVRIARCLGR